MPLRSGYEPIGALYSLANVSANLDRYPRWLIQTQTPAVAVAVETTRRVIARERARTITAVTICVALSGWLTHESVEHGALAARLLERRYVDVGRYIEAVLPVNSVFIARLHAGSIRYYSGRLTIDYEWLLGGEAFLGLQHACWMCRGS